MLTRQNVIDGYQYLKSLNIDNTLVYNSIDIREASFKIAPVDNNIFPAGFNNIANDSIKNFENNINNYAKKNDIKSVIILCEEHTRNLGYLKNACILLSAVQNCGLNVILATFGNDIKFAEMETGMVKVHNIKIINDKIGTDEIPNPDLIILNNDLSGKSVEDLIFAKLLNSNNVLPSPNFGWHRRKKSDHFVSYQKLAEEVAQKCNFDSWLINAYFEKSECHNFSDEKELQKLADSTSDLIKKIKIKYKEYKITSSPAVFLKAESGTYGLGVEKINDAKDILHPNRTFRKNIVYSKSKISNTQFLLQEAVPTCILTQGATSERTIYTSFGEIIGGFYRRHKNKTSMENLNSKGAEFLPIPCEELNDALLPIYFIATLSSYSAIREFENE